MLNIILKYINL